MAWARALARAGLLTDAERDRDRGRVWRPSGPSWTAARFPFRPELEDIHMNVERRLLELVGEVGGKLHTGRSRNDQIALDERLYLNDVGGAHRARHLRAVQQALLARAERDDRHRRCPATRTCSGRSPIVLAHHLLAYVFMLAARPRAVRRRGRARRRDAARRRRAGRHGVPDRPRGAGPRSRVRRRHAPTAWMRWAIATTCSSTWPPPPSSACTCRGWPPISRCGPPRSSASWSSPTPSPPARRSCRRRRTPTWPS